MNSRLLNPSEKTLIHQFITSLNEQDLSLFFQTISREDQLYLQVDLASTEDDLLDILEEIRGNYIDYLDSPGIADALVFENKANTKGYVVIVPNVRTTVRFINETEVEGLKLPVVIEEKQLKVKIFLDH